MSLHLGADGFLVVRRLYSFTLLTPPELQTSWDLNDNTSVTTSDVLSDFHPAESMARTLSNLNASTSSSSSVLSTGPVLSPTPLDASILGVGVKRKGSIPLHGKEIPGASSDMSFFIAGGVRSCTQVRA